MAFAHRPFMFANIRTGKDVPEIVDCIERQDGLRSV